MERVLVLGGGFDQIALINELKSRGYRTILADYYPNPPAKQYADCHYQASTLDFQSIIDIAKKERVCLVCTACTDQALLTVAKVSETLNLPTYLSYETALNVTNKHYMKAQLTKYNVRTSKYVSKCDDNIEDLNDLIFPLVVKPADCNSSKGVNKVYDKDQLLFYLKQALVMSRSKTAIVEEFISGREVSADFYVEENRVVFLSATSSAKIKNDKAFTIVQSLYPAISSLQEHEITKIATLICKAFNLRNTPLLVQFIEHEGKFYVIEFSARMGGGTKYKLIQVLTGLNIMSIYVDLILGNKPVIGNLLRTVKNASLTYVYCSSGRVHRFVGFADLVKDAVISDYFFYKTPGMEIKKAETSSDRAAGYLITAETIADLHKKEKEANIRLAVLDENGEDIMLHNIVNNGE